MFLAAVLPGILLFAHYVPPVLYAKSALAQVPRDSKFPQLLSKPKDLVLKPTSPYTPVNLTIMGNPTFIDLKIVSASTGKRIPFPVMYEGLHNSSSRLRLTSEADLNRLPPGQYSASVIYFKKPKDYIGWGIKIVEFDGYSYQCQEMELRRGRRDSSVMLDTFKITVQSDVPKLEPAGEEDNRPGNVDWKRLDSIASIASQVDWIPGTSLRVLAKQLYDECAPLGALSALDRYWLSSAWLASHMRYRQGTTDEIYDRRKILRRPVLEGYCSWFADVADGLMREFGLDSRTIESIKEGDHAFNAVNIEGVDLLCDITWSAGAIQIPWRPKWLGVDGTAEERRNFSNCAAHIPAHPERIGPAK